MNAGLRSRNWRNRFRNSTMKSSLVDITAGAFLLLTGGIVWKAGERVPPSFLDAGFGSGYLPQLVGAAICVLSAILLVQGIVKARSKTVAATPDDPMKQRQPDWRPVSQLLLFLLLLVGLEFQTVSFYPAAFIFMSLSIYLLGTLSIRRLIAAALVSGSATGLIWFLFNKVFLVII